MAGLGGTMRRRQTAVALCVVLFASSFVSIPVSANGPPAQVVISTPSTVISSDGVLQMEATLYDALNNVVDGEITWSASNGTIEETGLFFPWSAGMVTIRAEHAGFNDTVVVSVEAGWGQSIRINTTDQPRAKYPFVLQADLIDSHDNPRSGQDVVWTVDGIYVGQGEPSWTPPSLGLYEVVARYDQLETTVTMEAIAGEPYEFVFPSNLILRSGQGLQLYPDLVDSYGQKMNNTLAGNKVWTVENGTITPVGYYYASAPGIWNLSVRAGAIWGNSTIRVVPADASIVEIEITPDETAYVSGESYRLDAVRTDSQGYRSAVPIPLGNWTVDNGILSQVGDEVHWTPGQSGQFAIDVIDSDVPASINVDVVHGSAYATQLVASQSSVSSGTQLALVHEAMDTFGNVWQVEANITKTEGEFAAVEIFDSYVSIMPKELEVLRFSSSYFDASTGIVHQAQWSGEVTAGRLAFIELPEPGTQVAADSYIDFDPKFKDAYGNTIPYVAVNWTVAGVDRTLEIRMADGKWYPTEVGEHEIRANADGVFAAVRINVVPGEGSSLVTADDAGLVIKAGVPFDIFVELVDVHQNRAPAESVELVTGDFVLFDASSSGPGYWQLTGVTSGIYDLEIAQGNAEHTIPLTIVPGQAVRVITGMANETRSQGEVALITVWAEDSQGNRVEVNPDKTGVSCTSGKASHVKSDTWEIELEQAGSDRSCTVEWNGLISQQFFDVDSVLLSGALGSTNTAVSIIIGLLLMIFIVLVVLIRKGSQKDADWDDEDYYDDDDLEEHSEEINTEVEETDSAEPQTEHSDAVQTVQESAENNQPEIADDLRQELATKAGQVGVMQAAPGTSQGDTGWYVDANTELQYWNVGSDGSWTRVQ
tara:strand:- start:1737 stop:4370 length:2634 start_codon:yes stop_codon:yes gene_type:complete